MLTSAEICSSQIVHFIGQNTLSLKTFKLDSVFIRNKTQNINIMKRDIDFVDLSKISTSVNEPDLSISQNTIYLNDENKIVLIFEEEANISFSLSNIEGRIIKSGNLNCTQGLNNLEMSEINFSSGFYLLNIKTQNFNRTIKLIKVFNGKSSNSVITITAQTDSKNPSFQLIQKPGDDYYFCGYYKGMSDTISIFKLTEDRDIRFKFQFDTSSYSFSSIEFEIGGIEIDLNICSLKVQSYNNLIVKDFNDKIWSLECYLCSNLKSNLDSLSFCYQESHSKSHEGSSNGFTYECNQKNSTIKIDTLNKIIKWLRIGFQKGWYSYTFSGYESTSNESSEIELTDIPYNVEPNGSILVNLTGDNLRNQVKVLNAYENYEVVVRDMHGGVINSSSHNYSKFSGFNDNCYLLIKLIHY